MNELQVVIDDIKSVFSTLTPETPLVIIRERLDSLFGYDNPDSGCIHQNYRIGEASAELITANGVASVGRAILYLHGGGYGVCSVQSHRDLCERLSHAAAAPVLALEYRLAPENPFPAALEDAISAYCWLLDRGHENHSIAVVGDSAGGGLSLAMLLALRQNNSPLPGCAAVMSPWIDLELTGETMISNAELDPIVHAEALKIWAASYAPVGDLRNPFISPIFGDFSGLPPLLVQVGGRETLLDDALRLVVRAKDAGVDVEYQFWPGQIHAFQTFGHRLADARQAIKDIGCFLKRHLRI